MSKKNKDESFITDLSDDEIEEEVTSSNDQVEEKEEKSRQKVFTFKNSNIWFKKDRKNTKGVNKEINKAETERSNVKQPRVTRKASKEKNPPAKRH